LIVLPVVLVVRAEERDVVDGFVETTEALAGPVERPDESLRGLLVVVVSLRPVACERSVEGVAVPSLSFASITVALYVSCLQGRPLH